MDNEIFIYLSVEMREETSYNIIQPKEMDETRIILRELSWR